MGEKVEFSMEIIDACRTAFYLQAAEKVYIKEEEKSVDILITNRSESKFHYHGRQNERTES